MVKKKLHLFLQQLKKLKLYNINIIQKLKSKKDDEELNVYEKYLKQKKLNRKERRKEKEQDNENENEKTLDPNDPFFDWSEVDKIRNNENGNNNDKKKSKKQKDNKKSVDKKQKAELEMLLMDDEDNNKNFDMNDILDKSQKKRKFKKNKKERALNLQDSFEISTNDDRFSGLYKSSEFHIDPTDPHYKPTENMKKLVNEIQLKRDITTDNKPKIAKNRELDVIAQTTKRKVNQFLKDSKKNKKSKNE